MRVKPKDAARLLAYAEGELAKPTTVGERRAKLEGHVEFFRRALRGSCSVCGRTLSDPRSVERGMGSYCAGHGDQRDLPTVADAQADDADSGAYQGAV